MIPSDLQRRIANNEREAFAQLYEQSGRGIYLHAFAALGDEANARQVVKQAVLALHAAITDAGGPVDADRVLDGAAEQAIASLSGARASARPASRAPEPSYETDDDDLDDYASPDPDEDEPVKKRRGRRRREDAGSDALLERVRARQPQDAPGWDEPEPEPDKPSRRRGALGNAILSVFLVLFLLVFLWILAGILMDFGLLPRVDLGFAWFNENVFRLFSL